MTQDPANPSGAPDEGSQDASVPQQPPADAAPAEPPASVQTPGGDAPASPYGPPAGSVPPPAAPPPAAGYPPPGGYVPPAGGAPGYPPQADSPGFPPQGGAPGYPPQGGAPGAPGYPPPGTPYPAPPGYPSGGPGGYVGPPFAVGEAVSYGWRKVTSNLGPWILVALIFIAVNVAWNLVTGGFDQFTDAYDFGDTNLAAVTGITFTSVLLSVVGTVISYLVTAFFTRGALDESTGRRPDVAAFFRIGNVVNVLLAALIVGVLTSIGLVLCILPGIAVAIFSAFVYYFTLDQGQDAITAVRSSWSLVAKNFGSVFLLLLALLGINILGAIPFGLGLFVTIPLSYVAVAFAYRRLVGQQPA